MKQDLIVEQVINKYRERSHLGQKKYGLTLKDNQLEIIEWLNHIQEELMDATVYIEKLKDELK